MINKQATNQNPATFVKTNTIIHLGLVMGQIMFAAVTFLISKNDVHQQGNDAYIYIAPVFAIIGFAFGHFLFRKSLGNIKNDDSLKTKLAVYQSATIKRFALLEGPSLFAIVGFLITGNMVFLGISAAIILYFIYLRPTKQKIADDLNLGYDEQAELN